MCTKSFQICKMWGGGGQEKFYPVLSVCGGGGGREARSFGPTLLDFKAPPPAHN